MGKIYGKNSNGGKRGGMPHGKIKIFCSPGTYTRSASELDRAWRVTRIRKKKRIMGKIHGENGKIWVFGGKIHGKNGENWVFYGKKSSSMGKIG